MSKFTGEIIWAVRRLGTGALLRGSEPGIAAMKTLLVLLCALAALPLCGQSSMLLLGAGGGQSSSGFGTPTVTNCTYNSSGTQNCPVYGSNYAAMAITPGARDFLRLWLGWGGTSLSAITSVGLSQGTLTATGASSTAAGSITGSVGQTCLVNSLSGGGSGGQLQLTLVTANTLVGATVSVTNAGSGYLAPATSGTPAVGGSNPATACGGAFAGVVPVTSVNFTTGSGGSNSDEAGCGSQQCVFTWHSANLPSGIVSVYVQSTSISGASFTLTTYDVPARSSSTFDAGAESTANTGTSQTSGTATASVNGDFYSGSCSQREYTYTIGSGWTQVLNQIEASGTYGMSVVGGWQLQTTAAALAFTATVNTAFGSAIPCVVTADEY